MGVHGLNLAPALKWPTRFGLEFSGFQVLRVAMSGSGTAQAQESRALLTFRVNYITSAAPRSPRWRILWLTGKLANDAIEGTSAALPSYDGLR